MKNEKYKNIDFKKPYVWVATWFGFGLFKPAPGTWGSFAAIPFGVLLFKVFGFLGLIAGIILVTIVGVWASREFDAAMGGHDNKMIVIDEVAGQWIALIPAGVLFGMHPGAVFVAFILFRAFDILKPWPIGAIDKKVEGAWGVMGDDLVAGIMAAAVLAGAFYATAG